MVPTLTWGFVRSNFSFAMSRFSSRARLKPRRDTNLFLPLRPANDFIGLAAWHFLVARKVHRIFGSDLGGRTHGSGVAEHLRQRHDCLDHLRPGAMLHPFDPSAARAQITHDRPREIFWCYHFHRHHRLQQHRTGLASRLLERHRTGDLKRHFVRVHFVVTAIVEFDFHIHHGIAREHSAFERLLNPLIHRLDVFLGNNTADDLVHKLVTLAGLLRFDPNLDVTVLATAASLTDIFALRFGLFADGFAIRNLRLADVGLNLILAHHAVNDDFQMQLAHAADDGLSTVGIGVDLKGRIFLGQLGKRHAHLFLVGFRLGLNRHRNYRDGELDRFQGNRMFLVTNRIARTHVFQAHRGADVARKDFLNTLTLVGVHLKQASDALGALRA